MIKDIFIVCRGAGDLATGIIHRLHRAGFKVLALETKSQQQYEGRFHSARQSTTKR